LAIRANAVSQTGLIKYYGHTEIENEHAIIMNLIPQLSSDAVEALKPSETKKIEKKALLAKQIFETFGLYDNDFQIIVDKFNNPKVIDIDFLNFPSITQIQTGRFQNSTRNIIHANEKIDSENCNPLWWRNDALDSNEVEEINKMFLA
jgi:hypothetical protein